jgi:hypothetical protein
MTPVRFLDCLSCRPGLATISEAAFWHYLYGESSLLAFSTMRTKPYVYFSTKTMPFTAIAHPKHALLEE